MKWLRKLFRSEPKIEPTGRVIDYRSTSWGYSLAITLRDDGLMHGFCWIPNRPYIGDEVVWRTNYGECRGIIVSTQWTRNVWDMHELIIKITERIPSGEQNH